MKAAPETPILSPQIAGDAGDPSSAGHDTHWREMQFAEKDVATLRAIARGVRDGLTNVAALEGAGVDRAWPARSTLHRVAHRLTEHDARTLSRAFRDDRPRVARGEHRPRTDADRARRRMKDAARAARSLRMAHESRALRDEQMEPVEEAITLSRRSRPELRPRPSDLRAVTHELIPAVEPGQVWERPRLAIAGGGLESIEVLECITESGGDGGHFDCRVIDSDAPGKPYILPAEAIRVRYEIRVGEVSTRWREFHDPSWRRKREAAEAVKEWADGLGA